MLFLTHLLWWHLVEQNIQMKFKPAEALSCPCNRQGSQQNQRNLYRQEVQACCRQVWEKRCPP